MFAFISSWITRKVHILMTQVWASAARLQPSFAAIDRLVQANLRRVLGAFAAARVGPHHFCGSTGYGHGDEGRAALDEVSRSPAFDARFDSGNGGVLRRAFRRRRAYKLPVTVNAQR